MKQDIFTLRPSFAAIAAALALSATPAIAQTDPAAAPATAPVTIAPPAPTVNAAPSEAPATDQTSNMAAPVVDVAPAAAASIATRSSVVVHTAPESVAPAPAAHTKVARDAVKAPVITAAKSTVAAPVAAERAAPAPAPVLRAPPAAVAAQTQTKVNSSTQTDEIGLYAGLGGAALLILGGGAVALGRRKRHDAQEEVDANEFFAGDIVRAAPIVASEPGFDSTPPAVAPVAMREPVEDRETADGFDLSRFGPHTRAAYRGPTADNPSLSLKKRLKVASFRDGRLRETGEDDAAIAEPRDRSAPRVERRLFGSKLSDRLTFRPGTGTRLRPATA